VFGVPVRLIVIETLSAAGLVNDENDAGEAARAVANLATISRIMGALVITSHHPSKDGSTSRGSSAIPSNTDNVITIKRSGSIRSVELFKARNAEAPRALGSFSLVPVELGRDERDRPITSMTVSMGEAAAAIEKDRNPPKLVEKLLLAIGWLCQERPVKVEGVAYADEADVRHQFGELKEGSQEASNVGRRFKEVLEFAESVGRIERIPAGKRTLCRVREEITDE
jgi:hypothetical protein